MINLCVSVLFAAAIGLFSTLSLGGEKPGPEDFETPEECIDGIRIYAPDVEETAWKRIEGGEFWELRVEVEQRVASEFLKWAKLLEVVFGSNLEIHFHEGDAETFADLLYGAIWYRTALLAVSEKLGIVCAKDSLTPLDKERVRHTARDFVAIAITGKGRESLIKTFDRAGIFTPDFDESTPEVVSELLTLDSLPALLRQALEVEARFAEDTGLGWNPFSTAFAKKAKEILELPKR